VILYTIFFKWPHKKKSGTDKSGERGGQGTSAFFDNTLEPNVAER
jgi:hypothetical protein